MSESLDDRSYETHSAPFTPCANSLSLTIWNANGMARQAISTVTDYLYDSSLIFITETWLLPPCCIPPTILHRHNSKESTVHLCHTRTLSDNPIRLTRPA
jgi:hypothetical protein